MTNTLAGREPIQVVELIQPFCDNSYGVSPCTATGGADAKCYNTRSTCQDTANWSAGTRSIFFVSGRVAEQRISGIDYAIPSLVSVSTSPAKLNYATVGPDSKGLGIRATCSITLNDHAHTDYWVDPYVEGRSWDTLDGTRGSFWTRWLARNKYRNNIRINVYEGYVGEALSTMVKRTYFLDKVSSIDSSGRVTLTARDVLARLEERKAQAPTASPGKLHAAIIASQLEIEIANAVVADYPSSGLVLIGEELITYTSTATSSNGIMLSGVSRGTNGTTAADHEFDSAVQECLKYTSQTIDAVIYDLLDNYTTVEVADWVDASAWETEVEDYGGLYLLTAIIVEPTSVYNLISEICEQTLTNLWWDEREQEIKLQMVRGLDTTPETLTDSNHIIAGSVQFSDMPRNRVSQVWTFYKPTDKAQAHKTEPENFTEQYVLADLESEGVDLYGAPSIRNIYSRWLTSEPLVRYTANRILGDFTDAPRSLKFSLDAKDRSLWLGGKFYMSHYLDVDEFGAKALKLWVIVSADETVPGERVVYEAMELPVRASSTINYVMASGASDYPGAGALPAKHCYIGDANGLLSDGTPCGTIS